MVRKVVITLAAALCAVSTTAITIDKRIIGGEDVKAGEFKFIVSLHKKSGRSSCAGTLLDSTTVLTAAHCVKQIHYVKAGTLNSNTGGVDANIASSKQHPDYELYAKYGGYAVNDIAILKLSTAIEKSENIDYATLPANGSDPEANSIAVTAGWGAQTSIDAFAHDKLSKVDILVHTRQDCVNLMQAAVARDTIVCAGGGGKNVCDRDSGGPLIDQKTGQLIGVTSFVAGTAEEGECTLPAVYTRVGSYINFIGENLEGLNSSRPKEQTAVKGSYSGDEALTKTVALSSNTKGDKAETPNPEKEPESTAGALQ